MDIWLNEHDFKYYCLNKELQSACEYIQNIMRVKKSERFIRAII